MPTSAPVTVLNAIYDFVTDLGQYFSQRDITYSITSDVEAATSSDNTVWTAGVLADQTMFVGSAVKTFMLAEYLLSDLSETSLMTIDDNIRSISSSVFGDELSGGQPAPEVKLEGQTLARNVLEAMISHSDNTATDAVLRAVGVDNVRDLISDVGLSSVKIPESTRQLFGYLATGQDVSPTWDALQAYIQSPPNSQPAINDVQSMLASASDMVKWYQTALHDPSFFSSGDLVEFKRISSMADALSRIVPDNIASYGKGGSITWNGFSALTVSGEMVMPTLDPDQPWIPVAFSFNVNWGTDDEETFGQVASIFAPTIKNVLSAAADSVYWTPTEITLTIGADNLTGTAGVDVFAGPGGGADDLQGLAGDDSFQIDRNQTGSISGGDGYDTVEVLDGELDSGLTFDGVERLVAEEKTLIAALAQLSQFSSIIPVAGVPALDVTLRGAGGDLDFSTRFVSTVLLNVDASDVTSRVELTGTAHADTLVGSAFDDVLTGGNGDDSLSGRGGMDSIFFGAGRSVQHDTLADLNGDTITGLGTRNAISITGSEIGRNHLGITTGANAVTLTAGGTSFELAGQFLNGDFMAVARGGADERTVVSFVNFLPSLAEGVRVDPASINGIANEPFLEGDGATSFTLQFGSAVSTFGNTLGYYRIEADGTIGDTHILFSNTLAVPAGRTVDLGTPADGERIGFFLIQNGANVYGNLPDDISFVAAGGGGPVDLDDGVPPVLSSASRGLLTITPILHSIAAFNPGGATQVLSGVAPGGRDLRIGFEDVQNGFGDNDFQDIVFSVHTNADNRFMP